MTCVGGGGDHRRRNRSDKTEQLPVCRGRIPAGNVVIRQKVEKGGYGGKPEVCDGVNGNKPDGLVCHLK